MSEGHFIMIAIDLLVYSGRNPRYEMSGIDELAENIRQHGILQPIIVRPYNGKFEVVVGERRVRAAVKAGLREIPAVTRDISDGEADELRLIENIHREDLIDAEKGDAIYALIERYPKSYPTIAEVARRLNKPYDTVYMWTVKSRKLSDYLKSLVDKKELTERHVIYLLKYDHLTQNKLADAIVRNKISTTIVGDFIRLYDASPEADLDMLANEAKGVEKVTIEVAKLPKEVRKEVKRIIEERKEKVEEARKKAVEKAWKAPRRPRVRPEPTQKKLPIEKPIVQPPIKAETRLTREEKEVETIVEEIGRELAEMEPRERVRRYVSLRRVLEGVPARRLGKEMVVKEGIVYTVGDYDCPHCKRHYVIKCDGRHDWVE